MKKKWVLCIVVVLVVIIGVLIWANSNKKIGYNVEKMGEQNYFLLEENNKYGVISKEGNIIIEPVYDIIEMPNPSKDIFICKSNYNSEKNEYSTKVYNKNNEQMLQNYYLVDAIKLNNVQNNGFYEKNTIKYKSNGKFGISDINGNEITKAVYESIEGFEDNEGLLLVKKDGKFGIININGEVLVKEQFDEIKSDTFNSVDNQIGNCGFIVGNRTDNGMRYGYIEPKKGKQILKNEFNDIYRIVDKNDGDNVYLVAFKDGKAGIYKNNKIYLAHEYEDIVYYSSNDMFVLQKAGKQGVSKFDLSEVIPINYENIYFLGEFINVQNGEKIESFNMDGTKQSDENISTKQIVGNKSYEIISTKDEEYKIINKKNNKTIEDEYTYVQYLFDNYFIAIKDSKYGVIDDEGNSVLDFKYNSIQQVRNNKVFQAIDVKSNIEVYNSNIEKIIKSDSLNILFKENYLEIYTENSIMYIDSEGKELENTELFKKNKIIAYKEKNKWGYKDSDGNVVVKAKYDFAGELNKYGYAAIKLDGKWGVVDSEGTIISEPEIEIETSFQPSFIKTYYLVEGYGEPYYKK